MNRRKHSPDRRTVLIGAAAAAACAPEARSQAPAPFPMRRGVNLGNALEAPREGEWGYSIEDDHLAIIADAGFDGVRLPVRWDAHMDEAGRVDLVFLARVHEVCSWAMDVGLMVQLNAHHYNAVILDPARHRERFIGLWRQIGQSLARAPQGLMFEVLNEPYGREWNGARLRDLQRDAIAAIRESNRTRLIVVGPGNWQNIDALQTWRPPEGEGIVASVHYYEPHAFTHQNAEWLDDPPAYDGDWGHGRDRGLVSEHIRTAAAWGRERGYAMQLGEFGVNRAVGVQQRAAWTRAVREACEHEGMAWCVWDFAGAFPVWDRERGEIIPLMLDALFA
jgi:endoglucanase